MKLAGATFKTNRGRQLLPTVCDPADWNTFTGTTGAKMLCAMKM